MTAANAARIPVFTTGDRMRKARELAGYGSQEFANLIGVSRNTVGNIESDRTHARKIVLNAWSLATGVSVAWLRDGAETSGDDFPRGEGVPVSFNPRVAGSSPAGPTVTDGDYARRLTVVAA